MNNQITLFMKKKIFQNIDVKIALKILIPKYFNGTFQIDLKKIYQ